MFLSYLFPHLDRDLLAALLGHREALLVVTVPLANLLVEGPAVLLVHPRGKIQCVLLRFCVNNVTTNKGIF